MAFTPPPEEPLRVDLGYARPAVEIEVRRKPAICALLDTGSPFGLVLSSRLVAQLSLPGVPNRTSGYARVDGKWRETPALAPLDEVRIGNWILRDVGALGAAPNENAACGSILGMAALSRFHLIFDVKHRHIWLLPR